MSDQKEISVEVGVGGPTQQQIHEALGFIAATLEKFVDMHGQNADKAMNVALGLWFFATSKHMILPEGLDEHVKSIREAGFALGAEAEEEMKKEDNKNVGTPSDYAKN